MTFYVFINELNDMHMICDMRRFRDFKILDIWRKISVPKNLTVTVKHLFR
jgi:hypothetical protein